MQAYTWPYIFTNFPPLRFPFVFFFLPCWLLLGGFFVCFLLLLFFSPEYMHISCSVPSVLIYLGAEQLACICISPFCPHLFTTGSDAMKLE